MYETLSEKVKTEPGLTAGRTSRDIGEPTELLRPSAGCALLDSYHPPPPAREVRALGMGWGEAHSAAVRVLMAAAAPGPGLGAADFVTQPSCHPGAGG